MRVVQRVRKMKERQSESELYLLGRPQVGSTRAVMVREVISRAAATGPLYTQNDGYNIDPTIS